MDTLDPCAWRYVLTMDDLASFGLKTRSDVVGYVGDCVHHIQLLLLSGEDRDFCSVFHTAHQQVWQVILWRTVG